MCVPLDHKKRHRSALLGAWTGILLNGCIQNNGGVTTNTTHIGTTAVAPTIPNGPRAAKIIFKAISNNGSFTDTVPSGGTPAAAGSGLAATTLFNADNTVLSTSPTAATWPKWVSSIELGISGSANANALNDNCARFASAMSDSNAMCKFKAPSDNTLFNCGAPAGYYRVSDYDCYNQNKSAGAGNGGRGVGSGLDTDGVYIRIQFSRDTSVLGANENIMAVLEYSASGLNPAPLDPSTCVGSGAMTLDQCADFSWHIFTKHYVSEATQPFLLLAPPTLASVNPILGTGGTGISSTKQFVIPLAGDASLTTLQIARTSFSKTLGPDVTTPAPSTSFLQICGPNSAFCVGTVFYSLTLYRI